MSNNTDFSIFIELVAPLVSEENRLSDCAKLWSDYRNGLKKSTSESLVFQKQIRRLKSKKNKSKDVKEVVRRKKRSISPPKVDDDKSEMYSYTKRKKTQCGVCGKIGHNKRTCPKRKSKATVICGVCKKEGHNKRTCPVNTTKTQEESSDEETIEMKVTTENSKASAEKTLHTEGNPFLALKVGNEEK